MSTDMQQTVILRGGPNDAQEIPLRGFQAEVLAPPGSKFKYHVYSYQKDEDGTIYGRWEEDTNI